MSHGHVAWRVYWKEDRRFVKDPRFVQWSKMISIHLKTRFSSQMPCIKRCPANSMKWRITNMPRCTEGNVPRGQILYNFRLSQGLEK